MPYRTTPLATNEYYHIYNRGVARQPTYSVKGDYERFLLCLSYYRNADLPCKLSKLLQVPKLDRDSILLDLQNTHDKTVELVAFCLMPNHFHLLIKQLKDGGVSKFMRQITDAYTRYFNTRHERVGPVFQGIFKATHVQTDEQLLHLSRYIHLNPLVSFVVYDKDFLSYPWSSLQDYLHSNGLLTNPKVILQNFKSPEDYQEFVMDQLEYAKELKKIKHLIFKE